MYLNDDGLHRSTLLLVLSTCSALYRYPNLIIQFVKLYVGVLRKRTVIVDTGPLKAVIDKSDPDHNWAVTAITGIPGHFVTCEAVITEVQHCLNNDFVALRVLRHLARRLDIVPLGLELDSVLAEAEAWAPQMDFADACVVHLLRWYDDAFVLTTDFRDFATYRVPFASPQGAFHV
jgi:predicted nucleic acid-binding protein